MKSARPFGIVLVLALAAGCSAGPSTTYTSADGSYSVVFPGKPTEKSVTTPTPIGPITTVFARYSTAWGRREYATTSARYPIDSSRYNVEKGLDGARDGGARNINATVTHETKIDYKGIPRRECEMTVPSGVKVRARMYIDNSGAQPILYEATVADAGGNASAPDVISFLDSMKLKR